MADFCGFGSCMLHNYCKNSVGFKALNKGIVLPDSTAHTLTFFTCVPKYLNLLFLTSVATH